MSVHVITATGITNVSLGTAPTHFATYNLKTRYLIKPQQQLFFCRSANQFVAVRFSCRRLRQHNGYRTIVYSESNYYTSTLSCALANMAECTY